MKVVFRQSFVRDLKKIHDQDVLRRVREVIEQVEAAASLQAISGLKKISATAVYFRIRIGDFRIGLSLDRDVFEFVRCLHRRDLYRYFP